MRSSYAENNYGEVFESIVTSYRPKVAVELGVLDGYSTIHIAKGIIKNGLGHLEAWDLFEDYEFKHGTQEEVTARLVEAGVDHVVTLQKGDAYQVWAKYEPLSVHLLHVDISNTGETLQKILELWDSRLDVGSVLCFEGGSDERDSVPWMIDHDKKKIRPELETNPLIKNKYIFGTYLAYPSMTCFLKRDI